MNNTRNIWTMLLALSLVLSGCNATTEDTMKLATAEEILGNPEYVAISYGGYREEKRVLQPTVEELKEDMRIMHAMGIRILRTYNLQLDHAPNVLKAIREIKDEDPTFEMYVMLGAWIDCKGAWGPSPDHSVEDEEIMEVQVKAKLLVLALQY